MFQNVSMIPQPVADYMEISDRNAEYQENRMHGVLFWCRKRCPSCALQFGDPSRTLKKKIWSTQEGNDKKPLLVHG